MKRFPLATYRLQFNREFTFRDAIEILDYLRELGISDIYTSPLFTAGKESTHGYDVCSFDKLNPHLGGESAFADFTAAAKASGLHLLLDMVPNHMSATDANPWWMDVLEHGRDSNYANFFDIDWAPPDPTLRNKVLLPVLEDEYEKVLESGKLQLVAENGKPFIAYYDRRFPVNGAPGTGAAPVNELIARQHYRLAHWRTTQLNYRRFFDVTGLVALKAELPNVFHATHRYVFDLLRTGQISGLRIDHPDGLWDPKQYFERLQEEAGPVYVVAEKILSDHEQLPRDWNVDGTTGYDFLNLVNGLFVDGSNRSAMDEIYREFTGNDWSFAEVAHRSKTRILEKSFAGELDSLTRRLMSIASQTGTGNFDFAELRAAVREVIACFPVYRTYADESSVRISAPDEAMVERAVRDAKNRAVNTAAVDFIAQVLKLQITDESHLSSMRCFVMKFQQLTGPAAAKGIEDTAFYRFNRLISLNEVGGDPDRFGVSVEDFHNANRATAEHWPHTLLATSTHDTKRGEDTRARIDILSEMPGEWRDAVNRWAKYNASKRTILNDSPAPSANDEYLLYQTLVGAWPDDCDDDQALKGFAERIGAFLLKAAKEAKLHTSWTEPNAAYETALQRFVQAVLAEENKLFLEDFRMFQRRVAFFGKLNSLAQTLLKITCPGVPDFYQGSELWDLSLVDPDNRRPVDFASRRQRLHRLKKEWETTDARGNFFSALLRDEVPGDIKLFLIWRALNFRRQPGDYTPLPAEGAKREHICALARGQGQAIVIVPRLVFGLTNGKEIVPLGREVWQDTFVPLPQLNPATEFQNILTGEHLVAAQHGRMQCVNIAEALKQFPVGLLAAQTKCSGDSNHKADTL